MPDNITPVQTPVTNIPASGGKDAAIENNQNVNNGLEDTNSKSQSEEMKKNDELEFAKKFEYLTQQEKQLRLKEEKLRSDNEKWEPIQRQLELLKTNPLKVLKENGWTFKQLAEMVLNDEKPTTEKQLEDLRTQFDTERLEREKRDQEIEEKRKKEKEEREKANFEKQIGQIKEAIEQLVNENEDDFELIKTQNAFDLVFDVIQEVYQQTNGEKVITIKEAAERVEAFLVSEVEKNLSAKKFKSKFQKIEESDDSNNIDKKIEEMRAPNHYMKKMLEEKYGRGLSNDMQSESGGGKDSTSGVYLTDDESKALLAEKLRKRLAASQS